MGSFEQIGVFSNSSKMDKFEFFQQFPVQNQFSKRVHFMEKIQNLSILGLMGQAILVMCMFADQQNMS